MGFEREVARVIEMDFRARVISPERLGAAGQEERVILPPDSKHGGPLHAEILLELWIEFYIARMIQKEVWISSLPARASSAESSPYASGAINISFWTP